MQIYEALKKDHQTVKRLLDELMALPQDGQDERREELIDEIRDELIPHARAEESVFYNPLRSMNEGSEALKHSYKEHLEAETLLRMLQVRDKINIDWKDTANRLRQALEHHISEEEGPIFDMARRMLTDEEATMMADAFESLKPQVRDEGFLKTTWDLVSNMMPRRFTEHHP